MSGDPARAVATLCHRLLIGLQLRVALEAGREPLGAWMFRLFRAQHEAKFLSSFAKLGLDGLPHAVACARYHVLSNAIGGVAVEYAEESERKAWVRFRYPRWLYDGSALAGIPVEASRGFLRGWYAENGVSLGNPRLGFVCVSEDMPSVELPEARGLCGYFIEEGRDLAPEERLRFCPGARPPPFDPAAQPAPPAADWSPERLAKAERNYALEYLRNGVPALAEVLGRDGARRISLAAARLIGLQSWQEMLAGMGGSDGGPEDAAALIAHLLRGLGDDVSQDGAHDVAHTGAAVRQRGLRLVRGLDGPSREDLLELWADLCRGLVHGYRERLDLVAEPRGDTVLWTVARY